MNRNRRAVLALIALCVMSLLTCRAAWSQGLGKLGINLLADQVPLSAKIAHDAVIPWVRLIAFWRGIQWDPNADDFSLLDAEVAAALSANQHILINFATIPWWANGDPVDCDWPEGECTHPPTDPQFFADFVTTTVLRYKDRVRYWEIWNEPEYPAFFNGTVTEFMNTIATPGINALKAADPTAIVMGPSTYESLADFQAFLTPMCALVDRASAHFYVANTATMFSQLDSSFLPWIDSHCDKPLWITETGIRSTLVGEAAQAADYVAAYAGAVVRPQIETMMVFNWCDGDGFGIVEGEARGFRPKRSFFEIQDYARSLAGLPNELVARDTFANNSTSRSVGAPVNGTATEVGSKTWAADSTLVFGTSEVTTSIGGDAPHVGGVPFNPPVDPLKPINAVEADVIVAGSAWVGLGFSLSAQGGLWGHGQVWAHLGPLGYSVYADGLNHNLANGSTPNPPANGLNNLRVEHNRTSNELTVRINGSSVLRDFALGPLGFTPSLAFASMHVQTAAGSTAGTTKVENFRIWSSRGNPVFNDGFETGLAILWSSSCAGGAEICGSGPPIPF